MCPHEAPRGLPDEPEVDFLDESDEPSTPRLILTGDSEKDSPWTRRLVAWIRKWLRVVAYWRPSKD